MCSDYVTNACGCKQPITGRYEECITLYPSQKKIKNAIKTILSLNDLNQPMTPKETKSIQVLKQARAFSLAYNEEIKNQINEALPTHEKIEIAMRTILSLKDQTTALNLEEQKAIQVLKQARVFSIAYNEEIKTQINKVLPTQKKIEAAIQTILSLKELTSPLTASEQKREEKAVQLLKKAKVFSIAYTSAINLRINDILSTLPAKKPYPQSMPLPINNGMTLPQLKWQKSDSESSYPSCSPGQTCGSQENLLREWSKSSFDFEYAINANTRF